MIFAATVVNNFCASYLHPTSSICWVPLLFCLIALEVLSTEIAQKHGRIYDLRGGGNIHRERMQVVDECPTFLFLGRTNLRHVLRGSWGSSWDRTAIANSCNQINNTPFIGPTSFPGFSQLYTPTSVTTPQISYQHPSPLGSFKYCALGSSK